MFNLAYYGGGGFPIDVLYDLPVLQRKFYLNLLLDAKEKEADAIKNSKNTSSGKTPPTPDRYTNTNLKIPKK